MAGLRATTTLTDDEKEKAEEAFTAYLGTFEDEVPAATAAANARGWGTVSAGGQGRERRHVKNDILQNRS